MQKSQEIETSSAVEQPADQRAAFEAWFTANDTDPRMKKRAVERDSKGQYLLMQAASAWNVWQAAHYVLFDLTSLDKQDAVRYRKLRRLIKDGAVIDIALDSIPESGMGLRESAVFAAMGLVRATYPDWKLVPTEPTEEMMAAGTHSVPDEGFCSKEEWEKYQAMREFDQANHRRRLCWDAMLRDAPQPPAVEGDET